MTKYIAAILLLCLTLPAKSQECKAYRLVAISAFAVSRSGSCIRAVGTVTFIRKYKNGYRFELMDDRDRSVMVYADYEPYTEERVEVFGTVSREVEVFGAATIGSLAGIESDKYLIIKGALPSRTGAIRRKK